MRTLDFDNAARGDHESSANGDDIRSTNGLSADHQQGAEPQKRRRSRGTGTKPPTNTEPKQATKRTNTAQRQRKAQNSLAQVRAPEDTEQPTKDQRDVVRRSQRLGDKAVEARRKALVTPTAQRVISRDSIEPIYQDRLDERLKKLVDRRTSSISGLLEELNSRLNYLEGEHSRQEKENSDLRERVVTLEKENSELRMKLTILRNAKRIPHQDMVRMVFVWIIGIAFLSAVTMALWDDGIRASVLENLYPVIMFMMGYYFSRRQQGNDN